MPSELVTQVRAKYPGAYDDMSDAELEKSILAKYPQYADMAEKSVEGFGENLLSSGGKFLTDTAQGVVGLVKGANRVGRALFNPSEAQSLAQDVAEVGRNAPSIVSQMGTALSNRYGSPQAILDTAYTDPVGVLADVSTLAGGVGLGAKAARMPGVVAKAAQVEKLTNPLTLPGAALSKTADVASDLLIGGSVRPSAALRKDFGGSRNIAQAIKQERVTTSDAARKVLEKSHKKTDRLITDAALKRRMSGEGGIPVHEITDELIRTNIANNTPMSMARRREFLGTPGEGSALHARRDQMIGALEGAPWTPDDVLDEIQEAKEIYHYAEETGGAGPSLDQLALDIRNAQAKLQYPLPVAQQLKREAQQIGYGSEAADVSKRADKAVADAFKKALEKRVLGVRESNARTQRALAAEKALAAAEDRPAALTNLLAGGTVGTLFTLGSGGQSFIPGIIMKVLDSPRLGSITGITINDIGRVLANPKVQQMLIAARAQGMSDELIAEMLKREIEK